MCFLLNDWPDVQGWAIHLSRRPPSVDKRAFQIVARSPGAKETGGVTLPRPAPSFFEEIVDG